MACFMIYVVGGCREHKTSGTYGAAAVVLKSVNTGEVIVSYGNFIPRKPDPTSQRAELTAIIRGLEEAVHRHLTLQYPAPYINVKIHTNSVYAVDCMTMWIEHWSRNRWIDHAGYPVMDYKLLKEAHELHSYLRVFGDVEYYWVPWEYNQEADES
ncbi:hypothetical protein VF21_08400 [Pseudogymnoascus sp. 05NY08]|nr:hypothetical protein VF21_08400 [Pseudogymnoascus sp. 05NY08]